MRYYLLCCLFSILKYSVCCVCVHVTVLGKGTLCGQCALVYSCSCTTRGQSEELIATSPCMCAPVVSLLILSVQAH